MIAHNCYNPFYREIDHHFLTLDCTSSLAKLVIRNIRPRAAAKRVYVFTSWYAVASGLDLPFTEEEIDVLRGDCPVDLFLIGKESHGNVARDYFGKPSLLLPISTFVSDSIFRNQSLEKQYDVGFMCMFHESQIRRKKASLFLDVLRFDPTLKALWIGGYNFYDRWRMESAYNDFFSAVSPPPQWGDLWTESEIINSWHDGGGIFTSEEEQLKLYDHFLRLVKQEGLNLAIHRGLCETQVSDALNRCRSVVVLSDFDFCPRAITESLACGVPIVALDHLLSGSHLLNESNSIILADHSPASIVRAIKNVASKNNEAISRQFFQTNGLVNNIRAVVNAIDSQGIAWTEIVDWQRPFETRFKQAVRLNGSEP